ncbi:MAG: low molecular weight phosphotyrosine protein phosphatase [Bacteroidetes bacterium]|nr:low molecular weight phosphotyrosine protein phosphatase [Bacteroidota bacterium]
MKILMVCLGNICRSPLADGLLKHKLKKLELPYFVDSAGTAAYHIGNQPDIRTQANAIKHGIDLSDLKARQFTTSDFELFDRIYVMDKSNLSNVLRLATSENEKKKVDLLLNLLPEIDGNEVPDPYHGGEEGFENVFQLLDKATDKIIQDLQKNEK